MSTEIDALTRQWQDEDKTEIDFVYSEILNTVQGRKFFFDLLKISKVGQQPFTPNALAMSFNCGELNVGNQILARIVSVNPQAWIQMQKEQNETRTRNRSRSRRRRW